MEIISRAKIIASLPQEIGCPICHSKISHYEPMLRLKIDFEDIERKIDEISERFPSYSGGVVKVIIQIDQRGDMICGHPVEYRGSND